MCCWLSSICFWFASISFSGWLLPLGSLPHPHPHTPSHTHPPLNIPSIAPNQGSGCCGHGLRASLIILWSFNCCLISPFQFHGCLCWVSPLTALLRNSLNERTFGSRLPLISARRRKGNEFGWMNVKPWYSTSWLMWFGRWCSLLPLILTSDALSPK